MIASWSGVKSILGKAQVFTSKDNTRCETHDGLVLLLPVPFHAVSQLFLDSGFVGIRRRRRCDSVERDKTQKICILCCCCQTFLLLVIGEEILNINAIEGMCRKRGSELIIHGFQTPHTAGGGTQINTEWFIFIPVNTASLLPLPPSFPPSSRLHLFAYLHQPRQLWFAHMLFFFFLSCSRFVLFKTEETGRRKSWKDTIWMQGGSICHTTCWRLRRHKRRIIFRDGPASVRECSPPAVLSAPLRTLCHQSFLWSFTAACVNIYVCVCLSLFVKRKNALNGNIRASATSQRKTERLDCVRPS